jgi:RNA polymerase sigma-70 factor (ECF subfamily)
VLGFSARETAEVLETTRVSVDSALQRARKTVDERVPARSQQAMARTLGDSEVRELVNRFARAWEGHDIATLVAMLAEDARMTMPPQPSWYQGRDAIAEFLGRWPLSPVKRFRLLPISANGQPATAAYIWDEQTRTHEAESIIVLTLRNDRIEEITAFRTPELFPFLGLPEQPPTEPSDGPTRHD